MSKSLKAASAESDFRFYLFFFIKVFSIYLSWRLFEFIIGIESKPLEERFFPQVSFYWEWLNNQLRITLIHVTAFCLSLLGYDSIITDSYVLNVPGYRGVAIGNYCLAFQFMYFSSCLIMLSPLPFKVKMWSIPTGILVIQALNIFRFAGMTLAIIHFPGMAGKMHDYFFNAAALIATLLLYMKLLSK